MIRPGVVSLWAGGFIRRLGAIAMGAFVLRLAYVLLFKRDEPALGDAIYYSTQAQAIADGEWFAHPDLPREAADHAPLTALSVAPISMVFANQLLAQRLFQVVLGVAVVVLIGFLGRRVAGERVGLIAAALAAVYPNLWMNDALVMSETISTLLLAGLLLALYRFVDAPSGTAAAWVGIVGGVAVLARAELALLVAMAMIPAALAVRSAPMARRLGWIAITGVLALLMLAPWTLYNASRFEEPVLISTNDGLTIGGANCDSDYFTTAVGLWHLDCLGPEVLGTDQLMDPSVVSARYRDDAFEYIGDNLDEVPRVVAVRVARVWGLYDPVFGLEFGKGEGRELAASSLGLAMYYALVPAAIAGIVLLRRRERTVWPLIATAVTVTVVAALFYGHVRFRIPAELALVVLAAVAVDEVIRRRPFPPGLRASHRRSRADR